MHSQPVYNPPVDYEIQNIDLLSLLFDSPECPATEDTILHAEAALPSNNLTRSQTRYYTKHIAHRLRNVFNIGAHGAAKDVVVCISSGQVLLPAAFYATVAAGGIYSSASYSFTPEELARQLSQGDAKLLISSPDCETVARAAAKIVGMSADRIVILDSTLGRRSLVDSSGANLLHPEEEAGPVLDWDVVRDAETLKKRTICLLYSSGTTGPPKGVNLTQRNLTAYALINRFSQRDYESRRRAIDPKFTFEYRTLAHLPTAHIAGVQGYFILPAMNGGTVFWMPKFNFDQFLDYNRKHRITFFFTVPVIYLLIAQSPQVTDQFKYMHHAIAGAAPMGPDLTERAERKLGCTISQTWGLSETTGAVTDQAWDDKDHTGCISSIIPNARIRLVDDDEHDVADGRDGEFIVQSPTVAPGYWKNAKATAESFTRCGTWFKTGDVGRRHNGKFYIIDRKKELIKYKGLQIAPAELEAVLISHKLIQDAAVIGVSDPKIPGNEVPRAFVVADRSKISEEEITRFIKKNLAPHKQLRGGICYMESIPRSANGKILRRELRKTTVQTKSAKL